MGQRLSKQTKGELYDLAALGLQYGLTAAVKWIMREMQRIDNSSSGKRRKRTVALVDDTGKPVRAGRFKVPQSVLDRAEIVEARDA